MVAKDEVWVAMALAGDMTSALRAAAEMGWEMKPRDATPEMVRDGHALDPLGCDVEHADGVYPRVWSAMFAAAPSLLDDTGPA